MARKGVSSSNPPPPKRARSAKDVVREEWAVRKITPETTFMVDDFVDHEDTKWGVQAFRERFLEPLFTPASNVYYPRLVRLFYQNMTSSTDSTGVLFTSIDGHEIRVEIDVLETALGVWDDTPNNLWTTFQECSDIDLHGMIHNMCNGQYADNKRNATTRSRLPRQLWFVDSVLSRNVHPMGHSNQRRGAILEALYSFHVKQWVSIPAIIWGQFYTIYEGLVHKSKESAKNWTLPFPYLITKILQHYDFPVSASEPAERGIVTFSLTDWTRSISRLPKAVGGRPDISVETTIADTLITGDAHVPIVDEQVAQGTQTTPFVMTQAHYNYLTSEIEGLRADMNAHFRQAHEDQLQTQKMIAELAKQFERIHSGGVSTSAPQ